MTNSCYVKIENNINKYINFMLKYCNEVSK